MRTKGFPVAASLWAISFSWWGNIRSTPPVWMSKLSPRYFIAMAEHSMCQPGRPFPKGVSQKGSPGLAAFQSAKSRGSLLSYSWTSTRAPAWMPARSIFDRRPYEANLRMEK